MNPGITSNSLEDIDEKKFMKIKALYIIDRVINKYLICTQNEKNLIDEISTNYSHSSAIKLQKEIMKNKPLDRVIANLDVFYDILDEYYLALDKKNAIDRIYNSCVTDENMSHNFILEAKENERIIAQIQDKLWDCKPFILNLINSLGVDQINYYLDVQKFNQLMEKIHFFGSRRQNGDNSPYNFRMNIDYDDLIVIFDSKDFEKLISKYFPKRFILDNPKHYYRYLNYLIEITRQINDIPKPIKKKSLLDKFRYKGYKSLSVV